MIGRFAESEGELTLLKNSENNGTVIEPDNVLQEVAILSEREIGLAFTKTDDLPVAEMLPGRIKTSPLARKMAKDNNLALSLVLGTGPGGRIVKRDILQALEKGVTEPSATVESPSRGL